VVSVEVGGPQLSSEGRADTISESDMGAMIVSCLCCEQYCYRRRNDGLSHKIAEYFVDRSTLVGHARLQGQHTASTKLGRLDTHSHVIEPLFEYGEVCVKSYGTALVKATYWHGDGHR
jgi:hypothetical protein